MEDKNLFARIAKDNPLIYTDPEIEDGMPCIAGTPIPVYVLLGHLRTSIREGRDFMADDERELDEDQIIAALQYAIDVLVAPYQPEGFKLGWLQ